MAWRRRITWAGTRRWGMLLLAVWLIATGLLPFLDLNVAIGRLLSALAVAAGVLILIDR